MKHSMGIAISIAVLSLLSILGVGLFGCLVLGFFLALHKTSGKGALKGIWIISGIALLSVIGHLSNSGVDFSNDQYKHLIPKAIAEPFSFGMSLSTWLYIGYGIGKVSSLIKSKLSHN